MKTADPTDELPRRFGTDILLIERIGCGGMGEVFLARKTGPGGFEKELVVKKILPHLARDPRFVKMFLEEARLAARLHHNHIVQIYDFGQVGGEYYLTMEYVPGRDLHWVLERCRQKGIRFPLDPIPAVGIAVCRALEYAQRLEGPDGRPLGIVHRDISPTNILLSGAGDVKLLDFGIARQAAPLNKTTQVGRKGKALYMSPEQMRGQALDGRSDLFSLGAVLFELATGTTHLQAGVRSPRKVDPAVPRPLDRIIRKALSEHAADRHDTASHMARDLEARRKPARSGSPHAAPLAALLASLLPRPERTVVAGTPLEAFAPRETEVPAAPCSGTGMWKDLPRQGRDRGPARTRSRVLAAVVTLLLVSAAAWMLRPAMRTSDRPAGEAGAPEAVRAGTRTVASDWTAGPADDLSASHVPGAPRRAPPHPQAPLSPGARAGDPPAPSSMPLAEVGPAATPPTPPPAAGPAPAPRPWSIRLRSVPSGADVRVDGALQEGTTPCEIQGTDPDRVRRIRILLPGHLPWERAVSPGSLSEPQITARLDPEPGALQLSSRPPGARIVLDGADTGRRTPARFPRLSPGRAHRISLLREGHAAWQGSVTLEPGQSKDLEVSLTPATGGIRLQTAPWTDVYLDGKLLGKTPLHHEGIPTGEHTLTLVNREAGIRDPLPVSVEEGKILKKRVVYEGSLRVTSSEPWRVLVNGEPLGTTPCDDITLTAGSYTVVLRSLDGDREQRFQVRVQAGRVTTVSTAAPSP